jgi:hypothetical protein
MLGLAMMAVLLRQSLRRWAGRLALRLFDHAFVVALGAGILANLWFHTQRPHGYRIGQFGVEMQTAWLVLIGVAGYSLASGGTRLVQWCSRACQIFSPAVLIVACQLFCLPTLVQRRDPLESGELKPKATILPAVRAESHTPVYLFLFDEWSYRRTYAADRVRSDLPCLADLSRSAVTFHDAHSPDAKTMYSVPAILRGTDDVPELMGLTPGFVRGGEFTASSQYPSIFSRAGCGGHRKIMIQWGFAVSLWVADELDVTRMYSCYARGDGWFDQAAFHVYNAAFFWTDPWSFAALERLKPPVENAHALRVYAQIREDVTNIIRVQSSPTFAVVHYPIPHPPYLVDGQGNPRGRDPEARVSANAEGYERNLAYLDRLVGGIVSELKAAGRFDGSLLILTSDHSWRQDPAVANPSPDELTHVPLILKLPGQTESIQVTDDFRTYRLGELIGRALQEPTQPAQLVQWLQSNHSGSPQSDRAGFCAAGAPAPQGPALNNP